MGMIFESLPVFQRKKPPFQVVFLLLIILGFKFQVQHHLVRKTPSQVSLNQDIFLVHPPSILL